MAISVNMLKNHYKAYTVEQLEKILNNIYSKKLDKNKFIKDLVDEFMSASKDANESASEIACIELLKEKTGKDYTIDRDEFYELKCSYESRKEYEKSLGVEINKKTELLVDFTDVLNYILQTFPDPFWKEMFKRFFEEVETKADNEKLFFLLSLYHNKDELNNFSKELINKYNSEELFKIYYKKCEEFYARNHLIG